MFDYSFGKIGLNEGHGYPLRVLPAVSSMHRRLKLPKLRQQYNIGDSSTVTAYRSNIDATHSVPVPRAVKSIGAEGLCFW